MKCCVKINLLTSQRLGAEGADWKFKGGHLRYHGRWIVRKNAKNLFCAVQIEKTEKNNLEKNGGKSLFTF